MYEATVCILQAVAFFAKKKPIRMVGSCQISAVKPKFTYYPLYYIVRKQGHENVAKY